MVRGSRDVGNPVGYKNIGKLLSASSSAKFFRKSQIKPVGEVYSPSRSGKLAVAAGSGIPNRDNFKIQNSLCCNLHAVRCAAEPLAHFLLNFAHRPLVMSREYEAAGNLRTQ